VELLSRARAGDDSARERLFASCRSYVHLIARAQVGTSLQAKVDASDVVQQTLLEAHLALAQFHGSTEEEWLAWLRKILSRNTADFVRQYRGTQKRELRREISMDRPLANDSGSARWEPAGPQESPSVLAMQKERELQLADAVSRLAADYQEVIVLRNLERLPFDEVARRMGRSRPAVQMLWMRAIQKLQAELERDDAPADE
jgi:RNA polymerase sigma-70 factor (ECF subfamily)